MNIRFGENIRRLRIGRNMTQEQVADVLGISFQAVSKWERGDTVPDLFMLPAIASFFGVSTDCLLGLNKSEQEEEVQEYIDQYSQLWQQERYEEVLKNMKKAVKEYPAEYRLLVRYLNVLIWCNTSSDERTLSVKNEVETVYERISEYCTEDSIRIWAKKLICKYYKRLGDVTGSGINFEDILEILNEMPLMQNCRDYLSCFLYPEGEEKTVVCRKATSELLFLLGNVTKELVSKTSVCSASEKVSICETVIKSFEVLYSDEDYGKNYINVAYIFVNCGGAYLELGEKRKANKMFNAAVAVAKQFDAMPFEIKSTSVLTRNLDLTKKDVPMAQAGPLVKIIEAHIKLLSTIND